jgi:hypothetical protein
MTRPSVSRALVGRGRQPPNKATARHGAVALLLCGLVQGCWPWSRTIAPTGPPGVVELEVEIDPRIDGADDLVTWIDEEGRKVLAGLPVDSRRNGVVLVGIGGELYDYDVTMTPRRAGEPVGEPRVWACECTSEELLERLRRELPRVADRLVK